ncbi:hypothetical protein OD350_28885 (plasmid) [Clostridium beijerinckii]|uniref:hypothetical protein n=1 Tax=Clostridium beijerinckii TaxID=1520 RepID=UPI0022274476|nr:hypothetical protein [Clostridium beijerinckii]UYZ39091.1 hypothetical protein OD350_28885 [Clostridium beijerinckii]
MDRGFLGNFIMRFFCIFILGAIFYCFMFGDSHTRKFIFITMIVLSVLAALYRGIKSILIIKFSDNLEDIIKAKYVLINIIKATFTMMIVIPIIYTYLI